MFNDYFYSYKTEFKAEKALVESFISCCKAGDDDGADELRFEGVDSILGYELALHISACSTPEEVENLLPLVEQKLEKEYYALAYDL